MDAMLPSRGCGAVGGGVDVTGGMDFGGVSGGLVVGCSSALCEAGERVWMGTAMGST